MNICVECCHIIKDGPQWYDLWCGAVTNEPARDPVTGKPFYKVTNDAGKVGFTPKKHPHCREVNTDGKCILYTRR